MEGSFILTRVKRLNKNSASCTEDTKTSLTSCLKVFYAIDCNLDQNLIFFFIKKYLVGNVGCNLDLLGERSAKEEEKKVEGAACFTNTRLKDLYSLFIW